MSGKIAIALENLCFGYDLGKRLVLRDVNLEIPAGAVTAILGANGSGKTTLMNLLLGILSPSSGTIKMAGRPHEEYSRRSLSQLVSLVPQDEQLPFEFSVIEYVTLGRAPYLGLMQMPNEADRQVAEDALAAVGLDELRERSVPSLSGGEHQLAMVARALAQEPSIILLDEPTSHLDLANRRRVLEVLSSLSGRGVSVVFTTHDPNAAASVADHVVLLRDGQPVACGPTSEVFDSAMLSATYGVKIEVVQLNGRLVVVG